MTGANAKPAIRNRRQFSPRILAERFVASRDEESPDRIEHPAVESTDGGNFMNAVTENDRCAKYGYAYGNGSYAARVKT